MFPAIKTVRCLGDGRLKIGDIGLLDDDDNFSTGGTGA